MPGRHRHEGVVAPSAEDLRDMTLHRSRAWQAALDGDDEASFRLIT